MVRSLFDVILHLESFGIVLIVAFITLGVIFLVILLVAKTACWILPEVHCQQTREKYLVLDPVQPEELQRSRPTAVQVMLGAIHLNAPRRDAAPALPPPVASSVIRSRRYSSKGFGSMPSCAQAKVLPLTISPVLRSHVSHRPQCRPRNHRG